MKATIEVKLRPFTVPNFVLVESRAAPRQEGFTESPKYALSELDSDTLDFLCEQFACAVFEKAGKPRPPRWRYRGAPSKLPEDVL
jgi:hypothetical protein